ncbi:hypothetical protein BS78_07G067600 [Paspalum vaginatum]|nr:hypothetical protein BS78_07G067600 [Paspalum vaginatum]
MDHRGEPPRTATADSIELGKPAGIVQGEGGDQADINTDGFDPTAEFAGQLRTGARRGEVPAFAKLTAGVAGAYGCHSGFAGGAERGLIPVRVGGGVYTTTTYGDFTGAELGEAPVGTLTDGVAGGERGEVLANLLAVDGVGDHAQQTLGGTGRATGILGALHASHLAERIRRLVPVAGVVATSTAVTGLVMSAGSVTPAAGLGLFALLLAGLWVIMIHVLRA